jgi:hypothetical protein
MNLARRLLIVALVIVGGAAVLIVLVLVGLQTTWGNDYVRRLAERQASSAIGAQVRVGAVEGSLFYGATLRDIEIADEGRSIINVGVASATYDAFDLIRGTFSLDEIVLERPVVQAGGLGLLGREDPIDANEPPPTPLTFSIGTLIVRDGRVVVGERPDKVGGFEIPDEIHDLDAELSLHVRPETSLIEVAHLSFVGEAPAVTLQQLTGSVTVHEGNLVLEDIDVRLAESSLKLNGTITNFRNLGGPDGASNDVDHGSEPAALARRP